MRYGLKAGPGVEGLPPAGHQRREVLKKRTDRLDAIAEGLVNNTDVPVYAIDPEKLKEEPEILKHYDFVNGMFTVTNPMKGKVYFWCRDDKVDISRKKAEARAWLGPGSKGWEIIGNCSCVGENHLASCPFPECPELKEVDGRRRIGDTILMRIDYDEYVRIHKRMTLVVQYREGNPEETLSEFVRKYEGMVTVVSGNADPRDLYTQKIGGGPLMKAHPDERGRGITKR
jgi:hypothetical protein